ncbi:MAG: GntR family transcriptional regulator [Lachnospiraceae bacterium]|jgi:DNA-binding GntR family transcriptional regulator|nr:GntR family transcriptional regulator [Lachnospiraceae bacterium]
MGFKHGLDRNNYLPLRDTVFHTLRRSILHGELKPGERLMEIRLANKLGVSRTPIREAIKKLETEGLVIMTPRKGAEVAEMTVKDICDVLLVRKTLEELAVRLCCDKITHGEVVMLKEEEKKFHDILKTKDYSQIADADVALHDRIYQIADNQKLLQVLNNLREQMYRFRIEYLKKEEAWPILLSEHEKLIECLEKGNKEEASEVIRRHIDNQEATVINVIKGKKNV